MGTLENEMRSYINTIMKKNNINFEYVSENWDEIKKEVILLSKDNRYNRYEYSDIYPNPYILRRGGKKSRRHKKRKSKKSRFNRFPHRKSKRHSRR